MKYMNNFYTEEILNFKKNGKNHVKREYKGRKNSNE